MFEPLYVIGIILAVLAGIFLVGTISMFFAFNIPALRKDVSGELEQKQIEEIRRNSINASGKHGAVNVFEELEKKAKVKKGNTHSFNAASISEPSVNNRSNVGTSILNKKVKPANPNFIIEKNIVFVSTDEVI